MSKQYGGIQAIGCKASIRLRDKARVTGILAKKDGDLTTDGFATEERLQLDHPSYGVLYVCKATKERQGQATPVNVPLRCGDFATQWHRRGLAKGSFACKAARFEATLRWRYSDAHGRCKGGVADRAPSHLSN